jgi:hypothetical protein
MGKESHVKPKAIPCGSISEVEFGMGMGTEQEAVMAMCAQLRVP